MRSSGTSRSSAPLLELRCKIESARFLELRRPGHARERNDVANVLHSGHVHEHPLQAEPEPRVRRRAVLAEIQVPPIGLFGQAVRLDLLLDDVVALFALAPS